MTNADPTSTLVLTGLPSHVTDDALRRYFIHEWQVHVRSVSIVPGSAGDAAGPTTDAAAATTGTDGNDEEGVMKLEPPKKWNEARVELSNRNEAWSIVGYHWKPWDPPVLNIDSIVIEGTLHDYRRTGPRIRRKESVGEGGGSGRSLDRRPPMRRIKREQIRQQKRKEDLRIELKGFKDRKSLLERQEEALGRGLALHKRMLPLMKDSDKIKKMKEILEIQKKFVAVKREIVEEITPALEQLEEEEKSLVASMEITAADALAASVAAAEAQALTAATNAAAAGGVSGEGGEGVTLNPLARSFRLDKRTTVLQVTGIAEDAELDGVRKEFEMQGPVSDLSWMGHGDAGFEDPSPTDGLAIVGPTLLVRCANRGAAERIKANCVRYADGDLAFGWYYEKQSPTEVVTGGDGVGADVDTEDAEVVEDAGVGTGDVKGVDGAAEGGGDGKGDKSMYWTEDDDLMVDYDDEEEEG